MATVEVNVGGEHIRISSEYDAEFFQRVAKYLNDKMNDMKENSKIANTQSIALRLSFTMASEYFLLLQELERLEKGLDSIDKHLTNLNL